MAEADVIIVINSGHNPLISVGIASKFGLVVVAAVVQFFVAIGGDLLATVISFERVLKLN